MLSTANYVITYHLIPLFSRCQQISIKSASAEQHHLVALAHAVEAAVVAQDFDVRLRDARAQAQVFNGRELAVLPRLGNRLRRFLAHARERGNRRQQ